MSEFARRIVDNLQSAHILSKDEMRALIKEMAAVLDPEPVRPDPPAVPANPESLVAEPSPPAETVPAMPLAAPEPPVRRPFSRQRHETP